MLREEPTPVDALAGDACVAPTERWAVVLAGGVGSRFWPLSTPQRPKQLLALVTDRPLLVDTLGRLAPLVPKAQTLVLTSRALASTVGGVGGLAAANVLTEPRPAGTAAALTWAAVEIERRAGSNAVMICVHADWAIGDPNGFRTALARAADAAAAHASLVTVGVVPSRPDTGFGYICPGREVAPGLREVQRFVEKPDRIRAVSMVRDGYLWNSGIFVWRVGDFLAEVEQHTPEVSRALAMARANHDAAEFFAAAQAVSVDVGVLERSHRVLVIAGDFGWDDVGTWAALLRVRRRDAVGNAVHGPVHALDAHNNVVHAESGEVVLYGVSDLVVVTREGLTLVTTVDRSADLKTLVESLPADLTSPSA
jgi:mannose-1-phosphate guanylyltransferase